MAVVMGKNARVPSLRVFQGCDVFMWARDGGVGAVMAAEAMSLGC